MKKNYKHLISGLVASVFLLFAFGSMDDPQSDTYSDPTTAAGAERKPSVEIIKHTAKYEPMMNSYTIHCRVKNNTGRLIDYIDLKATFYDKNGNIVGTGMGNAVNLAGGAEKTIDVFALDIDNADKYEVQIDNVF